MPRTYAGKLAIGFMSAFFLIFGAVILLSLFGPIGGNSILDNPLFGILMIAAGVCIIFSFIFSLISILKKRERAISVYISVGIGAYMCFLLIGELLSAVGILPTH